MVNFSNLRKGLSRRVDKHFVSGVSSKAVRNIPVTESSSRVAVEVSVHFRHLTKAGNQVMKWSNKVLATYASQINSTFNSFDAERMPFAMPAIGMCMSAAAASAMINMKTGVFTPVSSFVVVLFVVSLLLVGLVIILSLLLTCLTRLMRLESLVRQIENPATRNAQGD